MFGYLGSNTSDGGYTTVNGTDRDRTDDLALRRRLLYPTEPQPQKLLQEVTPKTYSKNLLFASNEDIIPF